MADQVAAALERLEEQAGKQLGDDEDPLLVSVRSGARESMPGMLDTVLNLGLNDASVEGLAKHDRATSASRGTPTGASCRCSATSSAASPARRSRTRSRRPSRSAASRHDTELDVDDLKALTETLQGALPASTPARTSRRSRRSSCSSRSARCSTPGPASARSPTAASTASPTTGAPRSTSSRWCSATRATRRASGVAFSPRRGHRRARAERRLPRQRPGRGRRLRRAHAARHRRDEGRACPSAHATLMEILRRRSRRTTRTCRTRSSRSRRGSCTCSRRATPSARPRPRCASRVDAVDEGLLTKEEALIDDRRRPGSTRCCTRPSTRRRDFEVLAQRRHRLAGRRQGRGRVHRRTRPSRPRRTGRDVILVRPFTEADDVAGFHAAKGILTSEGGKASHAALVARGMGAPGGGRRRRARRSTSSAQTISRQRHDAPRGRPHRHRRHARAA